MRPVLALLIMTLAIDRARLSAAPAPECPERDLAVTIQIHDYAHVREDSWSRASDVVTRLYRKIEVRTEWRGVLRPGDRPTRAARGQEPREDPIAQLTIIVLTPEMAARGRVRDGVLGYAAVAENGMGRIAYVIYDRVRQVAMEAAANEVELLGFVMAHEIGHLLLGRGSQSETGLMRGHWDRQDLRRVDALKLEFSAPEARQIRSTIENESARIAALAAGAGARAANTCLATDINRGDSR
jgi:hypothetical protein